MVLWSVPLGEEAMARKGGGTELWFLQDERTEGTTKVGFVQPRGERGNMLIGIEGKRLGIKLFF